VAAELMLVGVAKVVLEEGAKFLYEQAGKVLDAWHARRKDPEALPPVVVAAPPQVTVGIPHPSKTLPKSDTVLVLQDLRAEAERIMKGEPPADEPVARATIAAMREIVEAALGTSITFTGEVARPVRVRDINFVANDVNGKLTVVRLAGGEGADVSDVDVQLHDIGENADVVVVDIGGGAKSDATERAKAGRPPIRILFLAANPLDSRRLRIDEEVREVKRALRASEFRDRFAFEQEWAVRSGDLQEAFLRHRPNIVHFSGHGTESSEIVLEDQTGMMRAVPQQALSGLFSEFSKDIRCVVLNACYSEQQAQAIAEHIDCVVGMTRAVEDDAAIQFATSFYRALGYGESVQTAFDLGKNQTELEGLPAADTPHLVAKNPKATDESFVAKEN